MPHSNLNAVSSSKWRATFEIGTTVVMIVLAATLVWQGRGRFSRAVPPSPKVLAVPTIPIGIAGSPALGNPSARVGIVQYSEFQCPFCGTAAREVLPALIRDYVDTGKIILVFKHLPLPMHPLAPGAASAAVCAHEQGHFWKMHDRLFAKPSRLSEEDLRTSAAAIGLDLPRYESCRNEPRTKQMVEADAAEAKQLNVTGTPTFFVGTIESKIRLRPTDAISGAKPIVAFQEVLNRLLR